MSDHSRRRRTTALLTTGALIAAACALLVTVASPTAQAVGHGNLVSVGGRSACAVLGDGSVECWGDSNAGALGRGTDSGIFDPGPVSNITDATAVAVGSTHACALRTTGTVMCWGSAFFGALGNGTSGAGSTDALVPVDVPGLTGVAQIDSGNNYTCARLDDGTVTCWGDSTNGLGGAEAASFSDVPVAVPGIDDAVDITTGPRHACVVESNGSARCWGTNNAGQLGDTTTTSSATPVVVQGLTDAQAVDAGGFHTCAIVAGGAVECWGSNATGQLGDGNAPAGSSTPVAATGVTGVVDIAAAGGTSCAVSATGDRLCWGRNHRGQLGDGTTTDQTLPNAAPDALELRTISGTNNSFCASTVDNEAWCWGENAYDQSDGDGIQAVQSPAPFLPETPDAIVGGDNNVCLLTAGVASCTGLASSNQLRNGGGVPQTSPVTLTGVGTLAKIGIGYFHMCGQRTDGTVACWGNGNSGQIGAAGAPDFAIVAGLTDVADIAVGGNFACVIEDESPDPDTVQCWGQGQFGQIGDGDDGQQTLPAETSRTWLIPTAVSAGAGHACAIDDQEIFCWGQGTSGQLGDGNSTNSNVPVMVDGIGSAQKIAVGDRHTCAITGTGQVECWGFSSFVGGGGNKTTPVDIAITNAVDIVASDSHTCALLDDQTVSCWGFDSDGRLGNGTAGTSFPPSTVTGLTNVLELSGRNQTCARTLTEIVCWGRNDQGEMGKLPFLLAPELVGVSSDLPATTTTTTTTTPGGTTTTTVPVDPPDDVALLTPVAPARLAESRTGPGLETIDGEQQGIGRQDAGSSVTIDIAGRAGVPDDASAAVVNLTAIRPGGTGFVTAHPCLPTPPLTSSLNFTASVSLGNEVITELDADGNACLFMSNETDISVDIVAYLPTGSSYTSVRPARLVDTRGGSAAETVDGEFQGDGTRAAASSYTVAIADRASIPATAKAAVINVTAIGAERLGFFTIHPCLDERPTTASLNYVPGVNRGNEVIAPLSDSGEVCVFTSAATDLAVDVVGFVDDDAYTPFGPARLLDTRPGQPTDDDQFAGDGKRRAGSTLQLDVAGRLGIPLDADVVTINLTAIQADTNGFATVHPCLGEPPNAASLNFVPGVNGGNEIVAELDADGDLCIFTSSGAHITVDIAGYTIET